VEDRTIIQPAASSGSVRRGVRLNGVYEIGPLIAHGGMGEVYRGFNIVTNDPVAIKMILPELSSNPDAFALFRREASTLHNLQHEAIVRYFVFSVDPELQRAYLAMEFVDGPSLGKKLSKGPLPLADVGILQQRLAGALDVAHRFGVIHRDISSDNVILPEGDPRQAKIIDFGIARSQRPGEGTIVGDGFAGKYNYVSPEQLGLAGGEVTAKSDIYSLGLVLAEALRGRPIDMGGSQADIIEKRRKVPDLSDIDPSMRPLIAAMLQPLPDDRPESMAAVAAWTPAGAARQRSSGEPRAGGFGVAAAVAAALIVIVSVGGTAYVFRDLLPWGQSSSNVSPAPAPGSHPAATEPKQQDATVEPSQHKLPELPPLPPTNNATSASSDASASQTPPPPHVPSADELVNAVNAAKSQKQPPTVVASNQPTNSAPAKPPGQQAETPAPSETPPAPVKPPPNHAETIAQAETPPPAPVKPSPSQQKAEATTPAVPQAPQSRLALSDATVGQDYIADLPPFSDSADPKSLKLRAEPGLPEGLAFADLGSGFGKISGTPGRAGQYSFDIVASDAGGATARMTTKIAIAEPPPAPQPSSTPPPSSQPSPAAAVVAELTPTDKTTSYLRDFDGGSCFLARSLGFKGSTPLILGVGADEDTFRRFYTGFNQTVGMEPDLTVKLIARSQCPALNLISANSASDAAAPKIELSSYEVGRNHPLAGAISNIGGRDLALLLVSSDGQVHRIETRRQGENATFSVPIVADGPAKDVLQVVFAIASPKPLPSLADFKSGKSADVLPRVQTDLSAAGGALETEFFRFVN